MVKLNFTNKKLVIGVITVICLIIMLIIGQGLIRSQASGVKSVSFKEEGKFDITLKQSSGWESDKKFGYVFNVEIKNISDNDISDWSTVIDFKDNVRVEQLWCGEHTSDNTTLTVKPVGYNKTVRTNSTVSFGFVAYADKKIDIEQVTINGNVSVDANSSGTIDSSDDVGQNGTNDDNTSDNVIQDGATGDNTANNAGQGEATGDNNSDEEEQNGTTGDNASDNSTQNGTTGDNASNNSTQNGTTGDNASDNSTQDGTSNNTNTSGGFKVSGTKLLDANGNQFIMRGVNHAHTWYKDYTSTAIPAIAKTGANTVRIVLSDGQQYTKDSASDVKNIIDMCKKNKLIAVLEVHDVTGSNSIDALEKTADYWVEIKDALIGNEEYVIINIANEWYGEWNGENWANGYKKVIPKLRNAGLTHTIMVDSAGWGQYPESIKNYGKSVFEADKLGNTMFSIHMYEYAGGDNSTVKTNIDSVINQGLCVCIGEFGQKHSNGDVAEDYIMEYCTQKNVGYLGWSWKGNSGGVEYLDITSTWDGTSLSADWGEILINGTNGIKKTSKICSVY